MNYRIRIPDDFVVRPEYRFDFARFNSPDHQFEIRREGDCYIGESNKRYKMIEKNMYEYHFSSQPPNTFIPDKNFLIDYSKILDDTNFKYFKEYNLMMDNIINDGLINIYLTNESRDYLLKNDVYLLRKIVKKYKNIHIFKHDIGLQRIKEPFVMLIYLEIYQETYLNDLLNQFHYLFMNNIDLFVRCIYTNDILVKHIPINKIVNGRTLYQVAAMKNNYDAVKYILKHYIDVDVFYYGTDGKDAYHLTTSQRIKKKMEKILNPTGSRFHTKMIQDEFCINPLI